MTVVATYNCKVLASNGAKVRPLPNTNNTSIVTMQYGNHFQISEILPDSLDPSNPAKKWGKIFGGSNDGKFTALEYPNNISPISSYTLIEDTPIPPEPPQVIFPKSFTHIDDATGKKAQYVFVEEIKD